MNYTVEKNNNNDQGLDLSPQHAQKIAESISEKELDDIEGPETIGLENNKVQIDTSHIKLAEIKPLDKLPQGPTEITEEKSESETTITTPAVESKTEAVVKAKEVSTAVQFEKHEITANMKAVEHIKGLTGPYALKVGAIFNAINNIDFRDTDSQALRIWLANKKDINTPQALQHQLNVLLNQKSFESGGKRDYAELDPQKDAIQEDGKFGPKSYTLLVKILQAGLNRYNPIRKDNYFDDGKKLTVDGKFGQKTWERLQTASKNYQAAFYAHDWRQLSN